MGSLAKGRSLANADWRAALDALHAIGEASASVEGFARRGVACLPRLVASELTTLSVCDLATGHRSVVSDRPGALSRHEIDAFDRHFHGHPLVREHGRNPAAATRRISDLLPASAFRASALFNDYYRAIRLDHAMAVPVHVKGDLIVSFVLNRAGRDFSERDRERLELIRPHLGSFYRLGRAMEGAREAPPALPAGRPAAAPADLPLTQRELEVLRWLAAGKTDRDIGDILGISPRTVHKHLQHIYEKLGVETRTAAVMRLAERSAA